MDGDLNFYNWTEYVDPDLITAFEGEFEVDIVETFYESNEAMISQIQSGVSYDVIVPSDYMVGILIAEGMLVELNKDAIPTTEISMPISRGCLMTLMAHTRPRINMEPPDSA